jgi:hypothetical protein
MRGTRTDVWALVATLIAAAFASPAIAAPVPTTPCDVFRADNVWRLDVSKLPVDRRSDDWKRAMHSRHTMLHPDFGPPSYGIPFDVVDSAHADVSVAFTYPSESDAGPYPFGAETQIEGGSDRHAIMIDAGTCTLYELYAARWNRGDPTAGSGAVFDLSSNALRAAGWTSADAAGLPIFPGLIRYDEVEAGSIDHAIRVTASCTYDDYLWPARHAAGGTDRRCARMGARFRLRASFDGTGFSPDARVVIRALKRYGMIVADNGSDWYFQGTVDPRWTSSFVDRLKQIPARAFVAVDERGCRVAPDSAAFAAGPDCPTASLTG